MSPNLGFSLCLSALLIITTAATDLNICSITDPSLFAYCTCDPDNAEEVVTLKCNFWGTPTPSAGARLWSTMGTLANVTFLEVTPRPARSLRILPAPQVFTELKKLTYFSVKYAEIVVLPGNVFGGSGSLAEVMLKDNGIRELDRAAFSGLRNLTKINLSDNLLTEINRHVFLGLPKLEGLYLDRNGIRVVHDRAFVELGALEELDLKKNNLTVIAREVFAGLGKLVRLELQDNAIEYLGDHVFADLVSLNELDLHDNEIRSVSGTAFYGLSALGRLNLKGNKIVTLEAATFVGMTSLYMLDVRANELERVGEALVAPIWGNLKNASFQVMMEGNRFTCSCDILWVQKIYAETASAYVKSELERLECNLFHHQQQQHGTKSSSSPSSGRGRLNLFYSANVTLDPEESTTTLAFDGVKHVIKLNPADFKCHHHHQHQNDHKDLQSDGMDGPHHDQSKERKNPTVSENKKAFESHHESHVDDTSGAGRGVNLFGIIVVFLHVVVIIM